jgi:hypothetical protein
MLLILAASNDLFVPFALLIGAIILFSWYFGKAETVKRKIRSVQEKPIHEFTDGELGKIVGQVHIPKGPLLRAPLSGRKCSYYYVKVEEYRRSGKSSSWCDLIEEEVGDDVILKNGKHFAIVKTKIIQAHVVQDEEWSSGFMDDATPELERFLKKHSEKSEGLFGFNRTLRYLEGVLEENELVAVVGKVEWKHSSQLNHKLPAEKILLVSPHEKEPVYLTDDPEVAVRNEDPAG